MAHPLQLTIKETLPQLKQVLRKQPQHLRSRIQMLILIKEGKSSTKRELADALAVNHNSVQTWRTSYKKGGLSALLKFERGGFKPSVITPKVHRAIEKRLKSPTDAFHGFDQLRRWIDENYVPAINYHTVNKYVKRHFGAKLKVARKSHILKDEQAVRKFKKNSLT
jgi:transposase